MKTTDDFPEAISRRAMIAGAGMAMLAGSSWARNAGALPDVAASKGSAKESLAKLKAGNERFMRGDLRAKEHLAETRKKLAAGQYPFATILCCSDSRVPAEIIFDQTLGDIFVVRVAGNVISTDVLGSIEYAALHLMTPLLMVLGHESCGAVSAAITEMKGLAAEPPNITALLHSIVPGLKGLDMSQTPAKLLAAGVEANVQWSLKQLRNAPEIKGMMDKKSVELAGGVYHFETGKVELLEESIPG